LLSPPDLSDAFDASDAAYDAYGVFYNAWVVGRIQLVLGPKKVLEPLALGESKTVEGEAVYIADLDSIPPEKRSKHQLWPPILRQAGYYQYYGSLPAGS
jgi:hypothetical protein